MSIKLKISDKVTPFSFIVETKALLESLSRLEGVTGYTSKADSGRHHLFIAQKGKLYLLGYSDTTFGVIQIPDASVDGKGIFNCPEPARVKQLLKNRGEVQFSYDGSKLNFKSVKGKLSGSLNASALTLDQVPRIEEYLSDKSTTDVQISPDLLTKIREGVSCTRIVDPYMNETLLIYMVQKKGKLNISSHDNYHLAMFDAKVSKKSPEIKMALPASMFEVVDKFVDDQPASFYMKSRSFIVKGENFTVGLPPVEVRDESFNLCDEYFSAVGKPAVVFKTDTAIKEAIANLMALNTDGAQLTMTITPKSVLKLQFDTDHGNATESLKVQELKMKSKKPISTSLEPPALNDLLSKIRKGSITVELYLNDTGDAISQCIFRNKPSEGTDLVAATAT